MRSKSNHHKTENTFKFQTFNERLSGINVDVARRVQKVSASPEDADTFFGEALDKWSELNCTRNFIEFRREIVGQIQSLSQLVHHQNEIVEKIRIHLAIKDSLAYDALLDLVVQLARDLQADFYPYFEGIFSVIVGQLDTRHHDTEFLEQAFTCLAYLFKILWRSMLKDMHNVYTLFAPLLGDSHREYINSFAAESFAFLIRRVKGHEDLFEFMFTKLEENPDRAEGVGRLLFESVKGVQKQPHSAVNKILPALLPKLYSNKLPSAAVAHSLTEMWQDMANFIAPQYSLPVWKCLLTEMIKLYKKWESEPVKRRFRRGQLCDGLEQMLTLVQNWVCYKNGILVSSPDQLAESLLVLHSGNVLMDSCGTVLMQTTAHLLLIPGCSLQPHYRTKLLKRVYQSKYSTDLILSFTRKLFDLQLLEKDVLPLALQYCHKCVLENEGDRAEVIFLLVDLILHKAPAGDHLACLYPLDFSSLVNKNNKDGVPAYIENALQNFSQTVVSNAEELALFWAITVITPHLKPIDENLCVDALQKLISLLLASASNLSDLKESILCVWCSSLTSLIHLLKPEDLVVTVSHETIVAALIDHPHSVHVLKGAALYFAQAARSSKKEAILTEDTFLDVFDPLQENLSQPYSRVRLLTLQICCQFPFDFLPLQDEKEIDQIGIFQICLMAEEIATSVHTYREKLIHLRKLDHYIVQNQLPIGPYKKTALYYLIGQLYHNFTLLWEPVMELIQSHAHGMPKTEFWEVYGPHLQSASSQNEEKIEKSLEGSDPYLNQTTLDMESTNLEELFSHHWDFLSKMRDRPDVSNFRFLLWQAMSRFPQICQSTSKQMVPLFFRFLENEYYREDLSAAPTQDLRRKEKDEENDHEEEEVEQEEEKSNKHKDKKSVKRPPNKVLLVHLQLFAKFSNPMEVTMEPRLSKLYHQLLIHRDVRIQQVAFECLMTYKHKYLVPYRENFERLLDDKSFKNEIVLFTIDGEDRVVQDDHRQNLLPVLMRILYGKMQTKTGNDTAGKAQSQVRKGIVIRFLAGCQPHELTVFLNLAFESFKHYKSDDLEVKVKEMMNQIDLSEMVPIRKQLGALNTVDLVLKKLARQLGDFLPTLVHIVVCILAQSAHLLNIRDTVALHAINKLKHVRQLALAKLNQVFENFGEYRWSCEEVSGMFVAAVWPQIEMLPLDGISHPTGLLTLLHTFTKHKRYWALLGKHKPGRPDISPLPFVFKLLHSKGLQDNVGKMVMSMVENLLLGEEEEEEENGVTKEEEKQIDVGLMVKLDSTKVSAGLGIQLLLPHVPSLLEYISKVVQMMGQQSGKNKTMPALELNILANLSEYVTDSEQSGKLISLLLPFLTQNLNRSQDLEVSILKSVQNLLRLVTDSVHFMQPMAKLFSSLTARLSRATLCDALKTIGEENASCSEIVDIVRKLNAWDPRRMEAPDYNTRLDGFREAQDLLQSSLPQPSADLLLLLVHNCCFLLNTTEDMSLRDSASLCMQRLIDCLHQCREDKDLFKLVIVQNLLPLVRTGIKHNNEVSRHEFMQLLAHLVKTFPTHGVFQDLTKLSDEEDVELDFFSNITHIQMHRRARAMKRLVRQLKMHNLHTDCLVSYLLPIVTTFIKDEIYAKDSNLLDGAVEALGGLAAHLPWPRYLLLLKHYLQALPKPHNNHKLLVRIVVAILDNFHFDLSKSLEMETASLLSSEQDNELEDGKKNANPMDAEETIETEVEDQQLTAPEGDSANGQQMALCPQGLASRIHRTILRSILPSLHGCLTQKTKSDDEHKKAQAGKFAEDDEILRVPIALAIIKLLHNLPHKTLQHNLPSVLLKVCGFLKSRANDIRNTARDTLVKIQQSLGSRYFSFILKEMRMCLTRGYQLHVLSFTVHTLLNSMAAQLKSGDLDYCVPSLVQVFKEELFGGVAEEKEVDAITGKLPEARVSKSYDSYHLISKVVTKESLSNIILPLKDILDGTNSHKVASKVAEILRRVSTGLVENDGLAMGDLLTFTYGVANEALPMLNPQKTKTEVRAVADPRLAPPSALLLPAQPVRGGKKTKSHVKTNVYLIVEFGLQVLNNLLKRSVLQPSNVEHLQLLDPFVETISSCLAAKHAKVTATALRCLMIMFKFPLPSLKEKIKTVTNSLFVLLSNYASAGAAKGDNAELIVMCFKAVTVLVRDVHYHTIDEKQLRVLLAYAEQDIHDHTRQATAFPLLRAIISRKLVVPEMHEVMERIEQLSIQADSAEVRLKSRQVVLGFLLDYPVGQKLGQHLEFYLSQLDYEHETGRESVLEMMATIFATFPQRLLVQYAAFFFVPLSSRLVNDESAKCRRKSALAIQSLLSKLDSQKRDQLFSMCIQWFQGEDMGVRQLAGLACGHLVEVESGKFERHLSTLMPILEHQTQPDKYSQAEDDSEVRAADHLLFSVLNLLTKIITECNLPRKQKWAQPLANVMEHVESHLLYPYTWAQLISSQIFGLLFAAWIPQELAAIATKTKASKNAPKGYLAEDTALKLHHLSGVFCKQLAAPQLDSQLADQVVKNLVFLGRVLCHMPDSRLVTTEGSENDSQSKDGQSKHASLTWVIRRLSREARMEMANNPKSTTKRSSVFKWLAAVAQELGSEKLPQYLSIMLQPLVQELTSQTPNPDAELKTLCQEVIDLLKGTVGVEIFTRHYATLHKNFSDRRDTRKRQRAMEVVTNPELAAKRKRKKNLAKQEAKKRKIEDLRPAKKIKKKKIGL